MTGLPLWVLLTAVATAVCLGASWVLLFRLGQRVAGSLALIGVLVGGSALLAFLVPRASGAWTVVTFLATIGLFKLMGWFEIRR